MFYVGISFVVFFCIGPNGLPCEDFIYSFIHCAFVCPLNNYYCVGTVLLFAITCSKV